MSAAMTAEDVKKLFEEHAGVLVEEIMDKYGRPAQEQRKAVMQNLLATENHRTGEVSFLPEEPAGKKVARFIMALALSKKGDPHEAVAKAKKIHDATPKGVQKAAWDETIGFLEASEEMEAKSLEAGDAAAGGVFVPEELRADLIPLLRANNVVRASGAMVVPMPFGNTSMNLQATTATSTFVDELEPPAPSQPSFGRLGLTARKLITLVPISNDMIRFGMAGFDAMIRDDIVQSQGNREDLAFIRDDGSTNQPKGLRFLAKAANVNAATAGATVAGVTSDLAQSVEQLESADIPLRRPGWIFTPRTKWFLMAQRGSDDQHIWRDEMRGGTIFGFPFRTTTQVPNTLGGGGDESEVYFADFASIVIGDAVTMEIQTFDGAAYDDSGTIRSAVSRDERVMRGISQVDIQARQRGSEISVVTAVDWIP